MAPGTVYWFQADNVHFTVTLSGDGNFVELQLPDPFPPYFRVSDAATGLVALSNTAKVELVSWDTDHWTYSPWLKDRPGVSFVAPKEGVAWTIVVTVCAPTAPVCGYAPIDSKSVAWVAGSGVTTAPLAGDQYSGNGFTLTPQAHPTVAYTGGQLTFTVPNTELTSAFWPNGDKPLGGGVQATDKFFFNGPVNGVWQNVQGIISFPQAGVAMVTFPGIVSGQWGTIWLSRPGNAAYWLAIPNIQLQGGLKPYSDGKGGVGFLIP